MNRRETRREGHGSQGRGGLPGVGVCRVGKGLKGEKTPIILSVRKLMIF